MKFTCQFLHEQRIVPYESDPVALTIDDGEARWYKMYTVVFEYNHRYYAVVYVEGLTENQDVSGNDCYPDNDGRCVDCPEVELYTELVEETRYRLI